PDFPTRGGRRRRLQARPGAAGPRPDRRRRRGPRRPRELAGLDRRPFLHRDPLTTPHPGPGKAPQPFGGATMPTARTGLLCPPCPACLSPDATVRLDLNDLQACECSDCGEALSPREAADRLADQVRRWEAVARWVEAAGQVMEASD